MSFKSEDIADYMQHQIFQISIGDSKKRGKAPRSERDYPYPSEENTKTKLAMAADVAPGVKRVRR